MKTIYENSFYSLNIYNNKYYRFDKIIEYYQQLSSNDLRQMLININN